jgi:HEAT repeat protein
MRYLKLITTLVLLAATTTGVATQRQGGKAPALDLKGKSLSQVFQEVLPGLGAKDIGARSGPQRQWSAICFQVGAPGREAQRAEACRLMLDKLGPPTPNPARIFLLEQLRVLGRAESVDRVAAVLGDADEKVRDAARRCLANNPAPEATTRLVAHLPGASGKARVGLVNALGYRADPAAVAALTKELRGEPDVAAASAQALGRIGTAEAAEALAAARKQAKGPARLQISDAYLLCADRRLREGKTDAAAAIYRELDSPGEARPIRLAALQGVLKTLGDEAGKRMFAEIGGKDADARAIAIGHIASATPGALQSLAGELGKLQPSAQVQVLTALAARGDRALMPAALAAAKSKDESVRRAGLLALGRLGDASTVPLLIGLLTSSDKMAGTAADSLASLAAPSVDDRIATALRAEQNAGKRAALIRVLERRRGAAAVAVLLEAIRDRESEVRASAFAALRELAEPEQLPALIQALLKADKGREREEAERAILAVSLRIPELERRAEPLLAALDKGSKPDLAVLLPLVGRLGGARALEVVRAAIASKEDATHRLGVTALCNWPDPSASADLLRLAQSERTAAERRQALRSLIRVNAVKNTLPGDKSNGPRLEVLKKAMDLSADDADRRQVLDALATVKEIQTLRYVLPYLDHKTLSQSACRTVVELAHSKMLRSPNRAAFEQALDRVITICRDPSLVERARKYRQGM